MSDTGKNKNIYVLDENTKSKGAIRKMAAIFAADVVGYSKLMASNEKLTLFRLKETRKITDKIINGLHGRIFSTAGDSIMAEFASPVDAMEAAISIQREVTDKAKEIKDNILIEFRIGINLGDIMTQDNNLYGDNVNIAARLESISSVGEITISEKVYQEVVDKVDIKFKSLGEKKLKNISKKIKVYISTIQEPDTKGSKSSTVTFNKKYLIASILVLLVIFTGGYFYLNSSSKKIEYSDNSKSVLENFRADQEIEGANKELSNDGRIVIALMDFQNQSSVINKKEIEEIDLIIKDNLSKNNTIRVINTPQGSENLNPPEVMLIATESNASFVINGIVFREKESSFLNLKIYEAKRGSLIVNQKIALNESKKGLSDFILSFSEDISSK